MNLDYLTDRRRRELKEEGVDIQKVEKKIRQITESLIQEDFTLQEAKLLKAGLDCTLKEAEKCNPNTRLLEFILPIQD